MYRLPGAHLLTTLLRLLSIGAMSTGCRTLRAAQGDQTARTAKKAKSDFHPRDERRHSYYFEHGFGLERLTYLAPNRLLITSRDPAIGTIEYLRPDKSGSATHVFVPVTLEGEPRHGSIIGLYADMVTRQGYFFQARTTMEAVTRKGAYTQQVLSDQIFCHSDSVPVEAFLLTMIYYVEKTREDLIIPDRPSTPYSRLHLLIAHSDDTDFHRFLEAKNALIKQRCPTATDRHLPAERMVGDASATAGPRAAFFSATYVCP